MAKTCPCSPHSDGEYTGPLCAQGAQFQNDENPDLEHRDLPVWQGRPIHPFPESSHCSEVPGHLAREGAGWSTVGCVSPSPPGVSLGPPPHSGCPLPPGSLGLWPRARPTHRRMYATSSRSMTRSSQPHRSSAWWVPCCRTQKGCRGALPARAPGYPKGIARKSPPPPEQVAVAPLIDQCIELPSLSFLIHERSPVDRVSCSSQTLGGSEQAPCDSGAHPQSEDPHRETTSEDT